MLARHLEKAYHFCLSLPTSFLLISFWQVDFDEEDTSRDDEADEDSDEHEELRRKVKKDGGTHKESEKEEHENVISDECEEVYSEGTDGYPESEQDRDHDCISIPAVVSLFFSHPSVTRAIDQIESDFFQQKEDQEKQLSMVAPSAPSFQPFGARKFINEQVDNGDMDLEKPEKPENKQGKRQEGGVLWKIHGVLDILVDLIEKRNAAQKLPNMPTREQILTDIDKLYCKRFLPFLHMLGIKTNSSLSDRATELTKVTPSVHFWFFDILLIRILCK